MSTPLILPLRSATAPGPRVSRGEMFIERVNPLDMPDWDLQVAALPGACPFHGSAWARVLSRAYGFAPVYFVARRDARLCGVLPVMEVNSWLTGRRGVSLPFTDHCELLATEPVLKCRLFDAAVAYGRSRHWRYLELRGGRDGVAAPAPASASYVGHTLELNTGAHALLQQCDPASRRALRKAQESALEVEFADGSDAMRTFHQLQCRTRHRVGVPPQPWRFFDVLGQESLRPGNGCLILCRSGRTPVAGAVFLHFGRTAVYKFGASDERFQHLRPNNLVIWRAIEWHARAGFTQLDFGRTSPANAGLRRFKLHWGTREHPIDYVTFDFRAGGFTGRTEHPAGWAAALLRAAPESVARVIGAVAYRHVA